MLFQPRCKKSIVTFNNVDGSSLNDIITHLNRRLSAFNKIKYEDWTVSPRIPDDETAKLLDTKDAVNTKRTTKITMSKTVFIYHEP